MSSKRTQADEHARRDAIVDAARACFLQFGFAKTTLEDIAKRAGISRPLLYRSFKNKDEITAAMFEALYARQYPRLEAALEGRAAEQLMQVCTIAILEPWEELSAAPMASEFYAACSAIAPAIEEEHQRRMQRYVQRIVGDRAAAEVFLLALEGLMSDLPTLAQLRKRLALLIDRFAG